MSSNNIYIKPTRLLIKQHTITKLKYFCKSTRNDYMEYNGSGVEWSEHLKKFGKFVETIWVSEPFTDKTELKNFAINFSIENNIVESNEWANRIIETGIGGGGKPGTKQYYNTITQKYQLLKSSEIKPHHIKLKNKNLQVKAQERTKNYKFYITPDGTQIRSKENLENVGYINKRVNFGENGNFFAKNIMMINLYTCKKEIVNKTNIPKYYIIKNSRYLFCILTPLGLKMSYSENILKSYLGTKGLKSLIDQNTITTKTKNKWLKSNYMNKNVSDIGFKYYPISEINSHMLDKLIEEGYEWVTECHNPLF